MTKFLEIEHKYVVDQSFDLQAFETKVLALKPFSQTSVRQVKDTYYRSAAKPDLIFRHRYDEQLQHLTVKSFGKKDGEVRTEINLLLSQENDDQSETVQAFLQTLEVKYFGCLYKDIRVFMFEDCEICLYKARRKDSQTEITCIEFEAKHPLSEKHGLDILANYEKKLDIDPKTREKRSLFELLIAFTC